MSPDPTTAPGEQPPAKRVLGPAQLKALAHPLRVEILDRLAAQGPLTASRLADLVG